MAFLPKSTTLLLLKYLHLVRNGRKKILYPMKKVPLIKKSKEKQHLKKKQKQKGAYNA